MAATLTDLLSHPDRPYIVRCVDPVKRDGDHGDLRAGQVYGVVRNPTAVTWPGRYGIWDDGGLFMVKSEALFDVVA